MNDIVLADLLQNVAHLIFAVARKVWQMHVLREAVGSRTIWVTIF
jgi:hypothetical protein